MGNPESKSSWEGSLSTPRMRLPFLSALGLLLPVACSVPSPQYIQACLQKRVDGLYSKVCSPAEAEKLRHLAIAECKGHCEDAADPENLPKFEDNVRDAINNLCIVLTKAKSEKCDRPPMGEAEDKPLINIDPAHGMNPMEGVLPFRGSPTINSL